MTEQEKQDKTKQAQDEYFTVQVPAWDAYLQATQDKPRFVLDSQEWLEYRKVQFPVYLIFVRTMDAINREFDDSNKTV